MPGTLAGQIVMEGFLNLKIVPWARRLVTRLIAIIPAIIVAALVGNAGILGPLCRVVHPNGLPRFILFLEEIINTFKKKKLHPKEVHRAVGWQNLLLAILISRLSQATTFYGFDPPLKPVNWRRPGPSYKHVYFFISFL